MDGLVSGVTTLTSQPQLGQIQKRVQSLCGWGRYVKFVKLSACFDVSVYKMCWCLVSDCSCSLFFKFDTLKIIIIMNSFV